jgi:transcription-repair coupling factor (superfamily II helicase)
LCGDVGFGALPNHQICLDVLTYRQFVNQGRASFRSITALEGLSSIGVVDSEKNLFIPSWFIKKTFYKKRVVASDISSFPLQGLEIKRGDYLVHRDHGVGVCLGLVEIKERGGVQEFLAIKYGDGGVLSVDVGHLDLLGYFAPSGTENIVLDSLAKKGIWDRKKLSAKKRAEETVQHLLNLYVKRNDYFRPPYVNDKILEKQFLSEFPYEDTQDQFRAWEEISSDLSSNFPMDRLLCGDVGFGALPNHQICLDVLTYRQFVNQGRASFRSITALEGLSSIGVVDSEKNLFIPSWFIKKTFYKKRVVASDISSFPLQGLEIKRGDYLVHRDHGVGVCLGLVEIKERGGVQEFLAIKYGDGGVLSVDVGHLDLLGYFAPSGTENIVLDSLAKKGIWDRKKLSAKKRAEETVQHLLNLYVKRNDYFRPPYVNDKILEKQFLSEFPYEDTQDQFRAWEEISSDLSSNFPMDRLLCGDVGFGKTELAIRAAFRVVLSKKSVVFDPQVLLSGQEPQLFF